MTVKIPRLITERLRPFRDFVSSYILLKTLPSIEPMMKCIWGARSTIFLQPTWSLLIVKFLFSMYRQLMRVRIRRRLSLRGEWCCELWRALTVGRGESNQIAALPRFSINMREKWSFFVFFMILRWQNILSFISSYLQAKRIPYFYFQNVKNPTFRMHTV